MATENRRSQKRDQPPTVGEEAAAPAETMTATEDTPQAAATAETAALPASPARTSPPRSRSGTGRRATALQNTAKAKTARPRGRPRKDATAATPAVTAAAETPTPSEVSIGLGTSTTTTQGASVAAPLGKWGIPHDPMAGFFGVEALYAAYKGKAFVAEFAGGAVASFNFLDLSTVQPQELMFDEGIQQQIQTALWTPIMKTAECRAAGLPLKQGVVLSGPSGLGKTFTAFATAKKCIENGWTFLQVSQASALPQALAIAERYYQPCVVFAEDVDQTYPGVIGWRNATSAISQKAEIVTLLTTSGEQASPGLAPGWIDAVIQLEPPSAEVVKKLIRMYGGPTLREEDQLTASTAKLTGYPPAAVKLAVERCIRAAIGKATARTKPHITDRQIAEMAEQLSKLGLVSSVTPAVSFSQGTDIGPQVFGSPEEYRRMLQATLQEYLPHAAIHAMDRMQRETIQMQRENGRMLGDIADKVDRLIAIGGSGASHVTRGLPARAAV